MRIEIRKIMWRVLLVVAMMMTILTFLYPGLLASKEKAALYGTHPIAPVNYKIDSDANDLIMVKRIHEIYDYYRLQGENIFADTEEWKESFIYLDDDYSMQEIEYVSELIHYGILVEQESEEENMESVIEKVEIHQKYLGSKLLIQRITRKEQALQVWVDQASNKILCISLQGDGPLVFAEPSQQLRNYSSYLNLDLLEDWTQTGELLHSKKACLYLRLEEMKDRWFLGVFQEDMLLTPLT